MIRSETASHILVVMMVEITVQIVSGHAVTYLTRLTKKPVPGGSCFSIRSHMAQLIEQILVILACGKEYESHTSVD